MPRNENLPKHMFLAYLEWRREKWFKDKEMGYNYDTHFAQAVRQRRIIGSGRQRRV